MQMCWATADLPFVLLPPSLSFSKSLKSFLTLLWSALFCLCHRDFLSRILRVLMPNNYPHFARPTGGALYFKSAIKIDWNRYP